MVSFKRPQVRQCRGNRSYRQDTAACVSLSKSTMSKTNPVSRTHRMKPGGGEERRI